MAHGVNAVKFFHTSDLLTYHSIIIFSRYRNISIQTNIDVVGEETEADRNDNRL